jgi:hypothetical protein
MRSITFSQYCIILAKLLANCHVKMFLRILHIIRMISPKSIKCNVRVNFDALSNGVEIFNSQ